MEGRNGDVRCAKCDEARAREEHQLQHCTKELTSPSDVLLLANPWLVRLRNEHTYYAWYGPTMEPSGGDMSLDPCQPMTGKPTLFAVHRTTQAR
eukprot:scaffold22447_cov29-Tisochrysis_lutea.AAC.5